MTTVFRVSRTEETIAVGGPVSVTYRVVGVENAGPRGLSAYEVAVSNGFSGTEAEWLDSLVGESGEGGGGTTTRTMRTVTANDAIAADDDWINADADAGAITLTLPTAVGRAGKRYTVKRMNAGANAVTIDANGSQTIDGDLTAVLRRQFTAVDLVSDGANWKLS